MRFSEMALRKLELDKIILPLLFNGQTITKDESLILLKGPQGRRDQLNNLVYDCSQMPHSSSRDGNGWRVHWHDATHNRGTKIILQDVKGTDVDAIYVHNTVNNHPSRNIHDCVSHVMANHSHVRKNKHEKGTMASCGLRREVVCSMINCYRPGRNSTQENKTRTNMLYYLAAVDFHALLMKTPLASIYQDDIKQLQCDNLVWTVRDYRHIKNKGNPRTVLLALHSSSAMSKNLTNSMHLDLDDAVRSTALFYSNPSNSGTTFLLFPFYRLAIECMSTTIVNWDGKRQHHCSCTMPTGSDVFSYFNGAWETVKKQMRILTMFDKKQWKLRPMMRVYFRIKQKDMKTYSLQRQDYDLHDNRCSLLLAEIVRICREDPRKVFIKFLHSKLCVGELEEPVFRTDCVCVGFVEAQLSKLDKKSNTTS